MRRRPRPSELPRAPRRARPSGPGGRGSPDGRTRSAGCPTLGGAPPARSPDVAFGEAADRRRPSGRGEARRKPPHRPGAAGPRQSSPLRSLLPPLSAPPPAL
ncbi:zinc finger CCHC domain-containing protein 3-like [Felis catus]|uniref:zinc finger CCHC domain-containing protein 3-like n=1 Tax=Felis catus TaxID=9685 RepID=UPI001D19C91C|nr:zinc finger CCHC domain-containing protein 3-like [Felis catus]